jgi:transketolase
MLPTAPDVRSSNESESNISPNAPEYDGESEGQKQARERRNKLKEGRRRRVRQQKEAQDTYKIELAEYHKRKSEKEAEEKRATRVHGAPSLRQDMGSTRRTQSNLASQRGTRTTLRSSSDNSPEGA